MPVISSSSGKLARNKMDAYFAGLPGGIVDPIALAEEGADVRVVTVSISSAYSGCDHSAFAVLVSQWQCGWPMAGETMAADDYDLQDLGLIALLSMIGLFGGRRLKLPVAHLVALLLALTLSVTGVIDLAFPAWLQNLAQYLIGVSLAHNSPHIRSY